MEYQEAILNKSAEKEALENNVEEMKKENAKLTDQISTLTAGNKNLARDIQELQEKLVSSTKTLNDDLKESKASVKIHLTYLPYYGNWKCLCIIYDVF